MLKTVTDRDLRNNYEKIYRGETSNHHFLFQDPETGVVFHLKNPLIYDDYATMRLPFSGYYVPNVTVNLGIEFYGHATVIFGSFWQEDSEYKDHFLPDPNGEHMLINDAWSSDGNSLRDVENDFIAEHRPLFFHTTANSRRRYWQNEQNTFVLPVGYIQLDSDCDKTSIYQLRAQRHRAAYKIIYYSNFYKHTKGPIDFEPEASKELILEISQYSDRVNIVREQLPHDAIQIIQAQAHQFEFGYQKCAYYQPVLAALKEYVESCETSLTNYQKFFPQYHQHHYIMENFLYGKIKPGLDFVTCAFWRNHYKAFAYTDQEYQRFRNYLVRELQGKVPDTWLNDLK